MTTELIDTERLCDQAAEAAVLGSMMQDHTVIPAVLELLTAESFFLAEHKAIFAAILRARDRNADGRVDGVLLRSELETHCELESVGGLDYLRRVIEATPTAANAVYYAKRVLAKVEFRKLVEFSGYVHKVVDAGSDVAEQIRDVQEAAAALQPVRTEKNLFLVADHATQAGLDVFNEDAGYTTGFQDIDRRLDRYCPGDLLVLAGRPSMGKTALGLAVALNLSLGGHRVLWCSLEMPHTRVLQRLIILRSGVTLQRIRHEYVTQEDKDAWYAAALEIQKLPLVIYTGELTPRKLTDLVREERRTRGIDVVFVDHLGLMQPGCRTNTRNDEVSAISRGLKAVAMQQCLPVWALCQLNRDVERREHHRPRMSDLRDSGSIEQDADDVLLLHREDYYRKQAAMGAAEIDGVADVIVSKSRNGPTGAAKLVFIEELMKFGNLSQLTESAFP